MTIASLLLALVTATAAPPTKADSGAVLLDFHAEWCGPCRQMRPAVEQLVNGGYPVKSIDIDRSPRLASRYHIEAVPTFIVVDSAGEELDRRTGPRPAAELARFYKAAAAKARPPSGSNAHVGARDDSPPAAGDDDDSDTDLHAHSNARRGERSDRPEQEQAQSQPAFKNPKPWETVVRIRVLSKHSTGFGSGTVIYSTPEESLILTCAHIFKLDRRQAPPAQFPRQIMVDLFDGDLKGTRPAVVHFLESVPGQAVDYDFTKDVGLIRIRPGRRLPASRVVPAHWEPQSRMKVLTVGCSEGQDATAWHTVIDRARIQNFLSGNPAYEAIECQQAPKQGRSGGGLFTTDGYIAGVCNFAEPQGNHGLYATPRSIYALLDRNDMAALYAPVSRGTGTMVAARRRGVEPRPGAPVSVARSQSPDQEEAPRARPPSESGEVMIPAPSLVGIADPLPAFSDRATPNSSSETRRTNWLPVHTAPAPAEQTDLNLDPAADHDRFGPLAVDPPAGANGEDVPSGRTAAVAASARMKNAWKPVRSSSTAALRDGGD
jgi:thiol-disulfide isomerase/thioredoxin